MVYGVNHVAADKAIYSNFVVYTEKQRIGVAAVTDDEMRGSAERFLPGHTDVDSLFAYTVRRDCGAQPFCLTLPTEFPGVPLDESLFFIFRAYINPGLTVSADPSELLAERVVLVQPNL